MALKLPRLTPKTFVTEEKASSQTFQRFWDNFARSIETAFNGSASLSDDVAALKNGVAQRSADNEFTGQNTFDQAPESPQGYDVNGLKVVGSRDTGWTDGTGTPSKGAFVAYAGHTWGAGYVQADMQALDDAAKADSQRLLAVEQALKTHGLIGA